MPITRRQFELEIDVEMGGWMRKIHSFLAEHKDAAFTIEELWEAVSGKDIKGWTDTDEGKVFDRALLKLVELRAGEHRKIRGLLYFSYSPKPLEI